MVLLDEIYKLYKQYYLFTLSIICNYEMQKKQKKWE